MKSNVDGNGMLSGYLRRICVAVILISAMALASASLAQVQTKPSLVDLEKRVIAVSKDENWPEASKLAKEILALDNENFSAFLALSRSQRASGDLNGALVYASRAHKASETDTETYVARVEIAAIRFSLGQTIMARFWLRQAIQVAPTDKLRETAISYHKGVAAKSKWKWSFSFGASPSSNVNNGSVADVVEIGGLPFFLNPDAKALSGVKIHAGLGAKYRFAGFGSNPAYVSFGIFGRKVELSSEAKQDAPKAKGSDYDYSSVEIGFGHALTNPQARMQLRADVIVGRNWYGGDPLSDYVRLGTTLQWGDARKAVSTFLVSIEEQDRLDVPLRSATILSGRLRRYWLLGSGDTLSVFAELRDTDSRSITIDHKSFRVGVGYDFGEIIGGWSRFSTALRIENRRYAASFYSANGREDLRILANATFGLPKVEYYGFSPYIALDYERIDSNIALYDTRNLGVLLGWRSSF